MCGSFCYFMKGNCIPAFPMHNNLFMYVDGTYYTKNVLNLIMVTKDGNIPHEHRRMCTCTTERSGILVHR